MFTYISNSFVTKIPYFFHHLDATFHLCKATIDDQSYNDHVDVNGQLKANTNASKPKGYF